MIPFLVRQRVLQHLREAQQYVNPILYSVVMTNSIYQTKPLGVFVTSIFAGAFVFNVGFDVAVTSFWDRWNQGVSNRHILRPPDD